MSFNPETALPTIISQEDQLKGRELTPEEIHQNLCIIKAGMSQLCLTLAGLLTDPTGVIGRAEDSLKHLLEAFPERKE